MTSYCIMIEGPAERLFLGTSINAGHHRLAFGGYLRQQIGLQIVGQRHLAAGHRSSLAPTKFSSQCASAAPSPILTGGPKTRQVIGRQA